MRVEDAQGRVASAGGKRQQQLVITLCEECCNRRRRRHDDDNYHVSKYLLRYFTVVYCTYFGYICLGRFRGCFLQL
jgi:hypothetical protein